MRKIMLLFFMLSQVVSAADINQSGAVNQVDLRKHDIVINNRPYKIKPGLSIDNRSELKRGSIVNFVLGDNKVIKQLEVRPNMQIMLPDINN
ncbi:MAG: hypothetical protein HOE45_02870 [Gammaproteobacteria bacterium]|nr:hypothetical protein [Gammaproteobacteria bacterium]MBT4145813.1 hypothetical protein [Gammaproteobacteria bacterium]MBT5223260.1 hypothetical protein [Gammaproteobacteria bacterium]MBT5824724.1 hypothetical protein [Gammaproteobacteria bacterium]MBT5967505.1 hypothetical protein [Gammaproteobacteria bacterium]